MSFSVRLCMKIYRRLARAFPHEFQMVYGADVVRLGEDVVQQIAKEYGVFGLLHLVADLAWRVPAEYLSEMRQDLIYAWRNLLKSPGLAVAAVLSLGLGIGVPTTGFSEVNMILLRDLPGAKDASRLLTTQGSTSYVHFERYRDHHDLFSGVTAYLPAIPFNVSTGKEKPQRAFGHIVSPEYFDVIGVHAMRGRFDNQDGIVISERFWRTRLDSDPDAIGKVLRINGHQATIAGIGPKNFLGATPILPADVFVPLKMVKDFAPEIGDDWRTHSDQKIFSVLMRVQPRVTQKSADAAADAIARQLDTETLDTKLDANRNAKGKRVRLLPGGGEIPRPPELIAVVVGFLGTLMALILGISCTNLANMLLAKAAGRRKEIAIRLAVGASRWRLIRQLLTESVLLSMCGGIAGFLFAIWLTSAATRMYTHLPTPMPINLDIRPDAHVLLFTFLLALIAGIGFGLAPALAATKTDFGPSLKEGASTELHGFRRFGLRNLLMVYQVAGSMALLIITGFIVLGFSTRTKAETTFDASNLYIMTLDPVRDGYSPNQTPALFEKVRDQVSPAIESAAFADEPPGNLFPNGTSTFTVPAQGSEPAKVVRSVAKEIVGANYFATLHVKMAAGREFSTRDEHDASRPDQPAVISEVAAEQMFGSTDPIGRRITLGTESFEVIGVTPDLRGRTFGVPPPPTVWVPLTLRAYQRPPEGGVTLIVRSTSSDAVNDALHQISRIDPNLSVFNVRTMRDFLDESNAMVQQTGYVYGGFGVFGLILASVGLAGVTAYSVAQRRREIGIRMALGAQRFQVMKLVMREGFTLVIVGCAIGFLAALAIGRILSAFMPEIADTLRVKQPLLLIGAPLLLGGLALLACYFPARRSTEIDPLTALRQE